MNGKSDESSPKPRTDAQPPRTNFRSFRVRSDSQSRCGRRVRSKLEEIPRQPCKPASLGDNDDDPGPTAA
jgi:hypothetical protein